MAAFVLTRPRSLALVAAVLAAAAGCGGGQDAAKPSKGKPALPETSDLDRGSYSPDGKTIAYRRVTKGEFARVGVGVEGDAKPHWITPTAIDATDFAWLPDSNRLLIAFRPHPADPLQGARSERFAVFDRSGRRVRSIRLDRPLRVESTGIAVAGDGRTAVIAAAGPGRLDVPTDLYTVDLATGGTRRLTKTPSRSEINPVFVNSSEIAFTAAADPKAASGSIAMLTLSGGAVRTLSLPDQYATAAALWPAKSALLYSGFGRDDGDRGLFSVPIAGGKPHLVLSGEFDYPSLSPDSRLVLVSVVGHPGGFGRLEQQALPTGADS